MLPVNLTRWKSPNLEAIFFRESRQPLPGGAQDSSPAETTGNTTAKSTQNGRQLDSTVKTPFSGFVVIVFF